MRRTASLVVAALLLTSTALVAQQTPPAPRRDTTVQVDTTRGRTRIRAQAVDSSRADTSRLRVRPRTAFIRSLLVPGWGQFSAGATKSAIVFVSLQAASDFMLVKTIGRLNDARAAERDTSAALLRRLTAAGDTATLNRYNRNPDALNAAVDSLGSYHGLVLSRKKQREDWITLAVFWTLASAADAFVVAQLSDFPADVQVEPREGGGMLFRVGIKTGRRR